MPTYQYRCTECGADLEVVQKFSDAALTQCPTCGGSLRKIFNAVGVVFKGSGFYRTDSRASGGGKEGGSDGSSKPDKNGEKKSEKSGGDTAPTKDASPAPAKAGSEKKSESTAKSSSSTTSSSSTGS